MSIETAFCTVTIKRYLAATQSQVTVQTGISADLQTDAQGGPVENPFLPEGIDEGDGKYFTQYKLYVDPIPGYRARIGDYFYVVDLIDGTMTGTYRMNKSDERENDWSGAGYFKIPLLLADEA